MRVIKLGDRGDEVVELLKILHLYPDGIFGAITEKSVKELLRKNNLVVDGIVGPKTWAILNKISIKKSRRDINEIIVHCTATKEGVPTTVEAIRNYHVKLRGFADIGYHYLVYLDGTIHEGRDINKAGAHCTNHNARSIGVCYVGGLDSKGNAKDTRTEALKESLKQLIKTLKDTYPKATVHGHREFANKDCPCFDAKKEYENI